MFSSRLLFGVYQGTATKLLRRLLSQSLRTSNDSIDSQSGMLALASDCRTRYRNAAESMRVLMLRRLLPVRWHAFQHLSLDLLDGHLFK